MARLFRDREDAGRRLAQSLGRYAAEPGLLVLAIPRGGVPVAFEVARALQAPLDVYVVRKLGVPGNKELAMGAIAGEDAVVLNDDVISVLQISNDTIQRVIADESEELRRREHLYRGDLPALAIAGRVVILVDDGLATGASMKAAVAAVRKARPRKVVVAVPVGALETCRALRDLADAVVCSETPQPFYAIGPWYGDFSQTTDDEVRRLLRVSRSVVHAQPARAV